MKRVWLILVAFLGMTAASVAPASADLLYTLNCKVNPCSGAAANNNYGSITLHQVGTGANAYITVTVDLSTASNHATMPENFVGTGAGYAIVWDLKNNPTLSSVTVTTPNPNTFGNPAKTLFQVENFTSGQSYKASPFGMDWEYAIDFKASGNDLQPPVDKLVFDIKKTGGLILTDSLFSQNDGFTFAVDIFRNGSTFTVASNDCPDPVPEPETWALFFAGMAGLTWLHRRRKLAKA